MERWLGVCIMRLTCGQTVFAVLISTLALSLVGCSSSVYKSSKSSSKLDPFAGKGSPYYKGKGPIPEGGGKYHVGKPYQVAGRWFTPKEQPGYDKTGAASWYGEAFHARMTSNGEWFDMNDLTAAHPTLPLPSYAKVTNLENGRQVVVRINDRGPFVGTRLIDLSKRTADVLQFRRKGKAHVRVQLIAEAPLEDNGYRHLMMMNAELERGRGVRQLAAAAERSAPSAAASAGAMESQESAVQTADYDRPDADAEPDFAHAGYVVHVATFASRSNADAAYEELSVNQQVQMFQFEGRDGALFRLQSVSIADEGEAQQILEQIQNAGFPDAKLRRVRVQQVAAKVAG
jgi:rare lipoprotein A